MAENERLVMDKVLGFRVKEVLDAILTMASKKRWHVISSEGDENERRLTIRLVEKSPEFKLEVTRMKPRALTGPFKIPQTKLSVWAREATEEDIQAFNHAMHIAFLRAGG